MLVIPGYHIASQIYQGPNALIYRGLREADACAVVIKIHRMAYPSRHEVAKFQRELDIGRRFQHTGILQYYGHERYQHAYALIAEDFDAIALEDATPLVGFDVSTFLTIAIQLANALSAVHSAGVIHKHLSAQHILINPTSKTAKLIDFGLALQQPTEMPHALDIHQFSRTLAYISPEQTGRIDRDLDHRTDFYSLGVVFYQMLTGELPFSADDPLALVHAHIAREPVLPFERTRNIPKSLSDVVMTLLHKAPDARYQSADRLVADLTACQRAWDITGAAPTLTIGQLEPGANLRMPEKLYGREAECEALLVAFDRVCKGAKEVVLVSGDAGVGKSALVASLQKPVRRRGGFFISGKLDQVRRNAPYETLLEAFKTLIRQLLMAHASEVDGWKAQLLQALGPNGQIINDVIPEVELIIGPQAPPARLGAAEAQNRFYMVLGHFAQVFAQPHHPLVIFLDDLQWADRALLQLIEQLMSSLSQHVFVIGAYRERDVPDTHPLQGWRQSLSQAGVGVSAIHLQPLAPPSLSLLIADVLACDRLACQPLAELVYRKTNGNPFYMSQFLSAIYKDKCLDFDEANKTWRWDVERIEAQGFTDNVIDLMIAKLRQLPAQTRRLLQSAACIGSVFDLQTVAAVQQTTLSETFEAFWPVFAEELLLPVEGVDQHVSTRNRAGMAAGTERFVCRFAHDRIQQAAYMLIPDDRKQALHLQIGRLMLDQRARAQHEKPLFDVVGQLNAGRGLMTDLEEREHLAELNLAAGRQAKRSAAYETAFHAFLMGIDVLSGERQRIPYALATALHLEAAEAAYLIGDFERMEALVNTVLPKTGTVLDRVAAYEVRILAYIAQNRLREAVDIALSALALLDIKLPANPSKAYVWFRLARLKWFLRDKRVEELVHLPEMTDPDKLAILRLIASIGSAVYVTAPNLMALTVLTGIEISCRYGNTPLSMIMYAGYGIILCGSVGDIDTGYQFGQLALALADRYHAKSLQPKLYVTVYALIDHRKAHLRHALEPFIKGYQAGLEAGDFEFAAWNAYARASTLYLAGGDLHEAEREMAMYRQAIAELKQEMALHPHAIYQQTVSNLIGRAADPCELIGEWYDETLMLPLHQNANHRNALFLLYFNKLVLCYLFEKHDQALEYARMLTTYAETERGSIVFVLFHFYDSLIHLALAAEAPWKVQKRSLRRVAANQRKMRRWARYAPMNHMHKYDLVEAERARVTGRELQAMAYYEQAIKGAKAYDYLNEEALAYELAAKFYLATGRLSIAKTYLTEACYAYQRWGASAKVEALTQRYGQWFLQALPPHDASGAALSSGGEGQPFSTAGDASGFLDILTVVKASQALSGERALDRLITHLMTLLIENAGAQRAVLILEQEGELVVEAEHASEDDAPRALRPLASIEQCEHHLPVRLIRYVERTRKKVILTDAVQAHLFSADAYIADAQPRSILCTPLIHQGHLGGMIYLENALTPNVFTAERAEMIQVLASQAAISIDNARLYDTLEHRVSERTQALLEKNEELEQARRDAEAANRAKSVFLATMSHEIRTPLNVILGYSDILERQTQLDADQKTAIRTISSSGYHLLGLINDVLDLSRVESGRVDLQTSHFDLQEMVRDISEMFNIPCQQKGLDWRVVWRFSEPAPWSEAAPARLVAQGDERRLRQVLLNLVSNAIKFTASGVVELRVELTDPDRRSCRVTFHVIDTGIGIAEADCEHIFRAFHQISTAERQEGTGLGLAIAHRLVALMGGELTVASTLGVGSRFSFTLTLARFAEATSSMRLDTSEIVRLGEGVRVRALVVDDIVENRRVLSKLLQDIGVEVDVAADGTEALSYLRHTTPDILFMDIWMPSGDGASTAQQIIETYGRERPTLVAVSASALEHERNAYLAIGFDDFIPKPIQRQRVYRCLASLLQIPMVAVETAALEASASLQSVDLPQALYDRLQRAARSYRVSQLDRYVDEVAALGPEAQQLAWYLRALKQSGDMQGIVAILQQLQS